MRALHQLGNEQPRLLDDPIAPKLLRIGWLRHVLPLMIHAETKNARELRSHVLLRSRYAEDRLREAAARGIRQFVQIGAGYDSFAYRQPGWARTLRIFEVDHAGTQLDKQRRLLRAGIELPDNLEFVGIDFETTSLREGLKASRLDFSQPTFFSCLGVLMYLSHDAVYAVFDLVADFPAGSEIAFTFSTQELARTALARQVSRLGEPWLSHFEPRELAGELQSRGYAEVEFLNPEQARQRYYQNRRDRLRAPTRGGIASAVVA